MSREGSANHVPFGYAFHDPATGESTSLYPPPGDRPLLHDEENNFLESFFNDPNNIDPNGLASMQGDYQAESSNTDWTGATSGEFPNPPSNNTPNHRSDLQETSAEVYAAAGILHKNNGGSSSSSNNNNNTTTTGTTNKASENKNNHKNSLSSRSQGRNTYNNAFAVVAPSSAAESNQMNGYTYPPLNSGTGPAGYTFESSDPPVSHLYELSPRYAQGESTNPYIAGLQNRLGGGSTDNSSRPSGPLAFGSDDNFRSAYVAPPGEGPDKTLEEALTHNFADNSKAHRQRRPPTAAMRKRVRPAQDHSGGAEGNAEDVSFDEDDASSKRRRREGEEGEDDYGNGGSFRGKKGKQRPGAGSSEGNDDSSSPGRKQRPATGGGKANRENLTEEQKRSNHIQSEQKRRNLIKQGFDDLNRMVPELRSGSLSKSNMLVESAKFMRRMRDDNDDLRAQLQSLDKG